MRTERWNGRRLPKYCIEDVDRYGNVRVYFRRPGAPKVRLHGIPFTEDFMTAYAKALAGDAPGKKKDIRPSIRPGSLRAAIVGYYTSAEFKMLDARTQRVRRGVLDAVCSAKAGAQTAGELPFKMLEPRHIRAWRDARVDRPEAANALVKYLRQVFAYAVANDLCSRNAARDVPYIKTGSTGFHSWTIEEVERFESVHPVGSRARLALALLLYTTQRRSDVVLLGRQHIREGWFKFVQVKNQRRKPISIEIPVIAPLQAIIDASANGALAFIVTKFGKPFTANGFGNRFRKWCDEAGLPHCSAHGLRKAAAARLAELGCTDHEIMAITGHQTLKEVARYTAAANRKKLAASGMAKFAEGKTENESVPLLEPARQSGTISANKPRKNNAKI